MEIRVGQLVPQQAEGRLSQRGAAVDRYVNSAVVVSADPVRGVEKMEIPAPGIENDDRMTGELSAEEGRLRQPLLLEKAIRELGGLGRDFWVVVQVEQLSAKETLPVGIGPAHFRPFELGGKARGLVSQPPHLLPRGDRLGKPVELLVDISQPKIGFRILAPGGLLLQGLREIELREFQVTVAEVCQREVNQGRAVLRIARGRFRQELDGARDVLAPKVLPPDFGEAE